MIKEAKIKGKQAARGNAVAFWGIAFLIALPTSLCESLSSGANLNRITSIMELNSTVLKVLASIGMGFSVAFGLLGIAVLIFTMPVTAGLYAKYLCVERGGQRRDVSVFDYYRQKDWEEKIKAFLLVSIYKAIGYVLFIIPGILISLRYSMLAFVFADNPGIRYSDAMAKCRMLTKNRRGQIFGFYLSFIGWWLLAIVTCGLSTLYSQAYVALSLAALYDGYCQADGIVPERPAEEAAPVVTDDDAFPPVPDDVKPFDESENRIKF